jgi:hypothetical protein
MQALDYWNWVSNPAEDMEVRLLSLVCVEQVAVPAIGWSLVQRRLSGWVFVIGFACLRMRDLEIARPRPKLGCYTTGL